MEHSRRKIPLSVPGVQPSCLAVANPCKQPIIGILGGIGSGKSTVARVLADMGCAVVDADKIAHELLERPYVKQEIVRLFGHGVLSAAGKIDRRKLAEVVFADAAKLSSINRLIHPLVLERAEELIEQYRRQTRLKAIVLDMPLLVEVGWAERCDRLIFVDCRRDLRLDRARKLGFFDENEVEIRENFQISLDKKAGFADNTVNNNSDFSALVRQVTDIFSEIMNDR